MGPPRHTALHLLHTLKDVLCLTDSPETPGEVIARLLVVITNLPDTNRILRAM